MLPPQWSRTLLPSAARTRRAMGGSVASNPVARMMVSAGCTVPSAVTTAWARTSEMGSVTSLGAGPAQGRVVVVGQQDPLASEGVVRGQLGPEFGVVDLVLQVLDRGPRWPAGPGRGGGKMVSTSSSRAR